MEERKEVLLLSLRSAARIVSGAFIPRLSEHWHLYAVWRKGFTSWKRSMGYCAWLTFSQIVPILKPLVQKQQR
ncbi:unnamed protein product [Caretta caretta]